MFILFCAAGECHRYVSRVSFYHAYCLFIVLDHYRTCQLASLLQLSFNLSFRVKVMSSTNIFMHEHAFYKIFRVITCSIR